MQLLPGQFGKLGKLPPKADLRALRFENYFRSAVPQPVPPTRYNWSTLVGKTWPMFTNDRLSTCTLSAASDLILDWTTNQSTPDIVSDNDIIGAYSVVSGYDPSDGSGDNGASMVDVMNWWRAAGIGRHKIGAWVRLALNNNIQFKNALWLLGGIYVGLGLPVSAQAQTGLNKIWDVVPGGAVGYASPYSWGGHAVAVVSYDATGLLCATWGFQQFMTWNFLNTYCDECYGVLSPDWLPVSTNFSRKRTRPIEKYLDVERLRFDTARLEL